MNREDKNNKFIQDIGKKLLRYYRIVAVILLIGIIIAIIFIDLKVIPDTEELSKLAKHQVEKIELFKRLNELLVHFIPILIIFILIDPLTELYNKIQDAKKDEELENQLLPISEKLDKIVGVTNRLNKYPTIEHFEDSFKTFNWKPYLDKATEVDLSIFYTNTLFNQDCLPIFQGYFKNNGTLNLFLPNPIKLHDLFFESSEIQLEIALKILRTAKKFREIRDKANNGTLNIQFLDNGFNYMYCRIVKPNKKLFIYSPYQNNKTVNLSPVTVLNYSNMSEVLENFAIEELSILKSPKNRIDLNQSKYIIWEESKNRVFISTSLSCPAGCAFCYVESIITDSEKEIEISDLGIQIAKSIITDPRFSEGEKGTTILLGGFTDPFLPKNVNKTIEIIKSFSKFKNFIHIATRFGIGQKNELRAVLLSEKNIIINYSFSSLNPLIEKIKNFEDRFAEMKEMLKLGVKVALYIRPVIPEMTIKYISEIIAKAKIAGIKEVAIGGLYVDARIKEELKSLQITIPQEIQNTKDFVLDDANILKKLKTNDVDKITNMFSKAGFQTFTNSIEIVNHHRARK